MGCILRRTIDQIQQLIAKGEVRISQHGYDELAADGLMAREVVESSRTAILLEDYPDYQKGRAFLYCNAMQWESQSMLCGGSQKDKQVRLFW